MKNTVKEFASDLKMKNVSLHYSGKEKIMYVRELTKGRADMAAAIIRNRFPKLAFAIKPYLS